MFPFKYGKLNSAHSVKGSRIYFPHQNKTKRSQKECRLGEVDNLFYSN